MAVFTIGSKTLSGSPTGGAVGGASNLTTVGAIPYVSASGVLNQDATNFFWDATNHRLGVGTASPSYTLDVVGGGGRIYRAGAEAALTLEGASSTIYGAAGTLRLATYGGSNGNIDLSPNEAVKLRIFASTGNVTVGGTSDGGYKLGVQSSGTTGTVRIFDQTATTGSTLAVIQAGAGQSGNLTEWRNNAGTALSGVLSNGSFFVSNFNGLFNAGSTAGFYVGSNTFAIRTNTTDDRLVVTSGGLIAIAGATSSFPALKRSTTTLQVRLADDSANTQIQASRFISDQTTPSASTDAGTAGAIWADATYIYVQTAAGTIKRVALTTF